MGAEAIANPADVYNPYAAQAEAAQAYEEVAGNWTEFIPFMSLYGGSSDAAKEGKVPVGQFAISKDKELVAVGPSFTAVLCGWRTKAMDFRGAKPQSYFDPKAETFKKVKHIAETVKGKSGCSFGPELLMWNPTHGFFTFFLNNETLRNEFPKYNTMLPTKEGKLFTVTSTAKLIDNGENKWHTSKPSLSSQDLGTPPNAELRVQHMTFLKPKDSQPEAQKQLAADESINPNR